MAIITGLTGDTETNLQLDAGMLISGVTETTFESNPQWSTILKTGVLGATKGGATFTATPEFRSLMDGVNGARGNYKDGQIIDSWDISLKATISEMTKENIKIAMGQKVEEKEVKGNLMKHTAKVGIIPTDAFINGVAWVGTIKGKTNPMVILLKDVLNTNGVNFVAEDKGTGAIELELKAHFDLSKSDDVPFAIYTPTL